MLTAFIIAVSGCSASKRTYTEEEKRRILNNVYFADCKVSMKNSQINRSGSCELYLDSEWFHFQIYGPFSSLLLEVKIHDSMIYLINHHNEVVDVFPDNDTTRSRLIGIPLSSEDFRYLLQGRIEHMYAGRKSSMKPAGKNRFVIFAQNSKEVTELKMIKWRASESGGQIPTLLEFKTNGRRVRLAITRHAPLDGEKPLSLAVPDDYKLIHHNDLVK